MQKPVENGFVNILITPSRMVYLTLFRIYRWLTGKDNAAFGWVLFFAMNAYNIANTVIQRGDSSSYGWFITMDILWLFLSAWVTHQYRDHCRNAQKAETVAEFRHAPTLYFLVVWNSIGMILWLIFLMPSAIADALLTTMWCLNMLQYRPGGKSVFAKAKAKIAAAAEAAKARSQPAFTPVPA